MGDKKILLVSNMYPSKKYPHYGVFVKNMSDAIEGAGINVKKVFCNKRDNKVTKLFSYVKFYFKLMFYLFFYKFDLIYVHYASHCAPPILIMKKIKKKLRIITNVHGNDIVPETDKDKRFCRLSKKLLDISEYVISPSDYFSKILISEYDCKQEKIIIIPSGGVNLDIFYPDIIQYSDIKTVGFVSRIEINKGWDMFLEMASKVIKNNFNVRFIVVGDGSEAPFFRKKLTELCLDSYVTWYSFLNQKELSNLYRKMDIFCFPTRRKSESLGLVGLEAMACGAIIVGSNKFGPSSYINHKINGFSFNPYSLNEFINIMEEVIHYNKDKLECIRENSIKTSHNYSNVIANQKLLSFIKEVI